MAAVPTPQTPAETISAPTPAPTAAPQIATPAPATPPVAAATAPPPDPAPAPVAAPPPPSEPISAMPAAETPPPPAPAAGMPDAGGVPTLFQLPFATRRGLPEIAVTMHMYSADPERRFALVNGTRVGDGSSLEGGLEVVRILPSGVQLRYEGTEFILPVSN